MHTCLKFIYAFQILEIKILFFFVHRLFLKNEISDLQLIACIRDISVESVTGKLNLPRLSCHSLCDSFHSAPTRLRRH